MNKQCILFLILLIAIYNLSFISANFVCGIVNSSEGFSSSWVEAIVYFEENESDFTTCKISPENKFCCDLENISSVNFAVGKQVFAEVFDKEKGLIAGPVSLYLTDEGYNVFPEMTLKKAILINSPDKRIFINASSILINISSVGQNNNLKYALNSSGEYIEAELCNDCTNFEFPISLSKGKNELIITFYGKREVSEKIIFYNLDYFNIGIDFSCEKCKNKKRFFYVPSEEEISVHSYFNSSHNISGDFLFSFPFKWIPYNLLNNQDISFTHKGFIRKISDKKEFSEDYTFISPKSFIKQDYFFYQEFQGFENLKKVRVFRLKLLPFYKVNLIEKEYPLTILEQRTSPGEPVIINSPENCIQTVGIFPEKEILKSYSALNFNNNNFKKNKQLTFTIITTIPQEDIKNIFLVFKAEKGKNIRLSIDMREIPLEFYNEDVNYNYYYAYVLEKGPFNVEIF